MITKETAKKLNVRPQMVTKTRQNIKTYSTLKSIQNLRIYRRESERLIYTGWKSIVMNILAKTCINTALAAILLFNNAYSTRGCEDNNTSCGNTFSDKRNVKKNRDTIMHVNYAGKNYFMPVKIADDNIDVDGKNKPCKRIEIDMTYTKDDGKKNTLVDGIYTLTLYVAGKLPVAIKAKTDGLLDPKATYTK